jgi:hypothetical protein
MYTLSYNGRSDFKNLPTPRKIITGLGCEPRARRQTCRVACRFSPSTPLQLLMTTVTLPFSSMVSSPSKTNGNGTWSTLYLSFLTVMKQQPSKYMKKAIIKDVRRPVLWRVSPVFTTLEWTSLDKCTKTLVVFLPFK